MASYRNSDPRPPIMRARRRRSSRRAWTGTGRHGTAGPSSTSARSCRPPKSGAAHGPVRGLPRAERDLDDLPVSDSEGRPTTLAGLLDETYTDGFLVLKDGAVAYERYFNGMIERTLHLSQSVAKSVVGTVCGILAGRGVVDRAAPVTDYLPELRQPAVAAPACSTCST